MTDAELLRQWQDRCERAEEYAEEMRAALEVAVSLVHIPDHAWDTDDDARLAKCVAALAKNPPSSSGSFTNPKEK